MVSASSQRQTVPDLKLDLFGLVAVDQDPVVVLEDLVAAAGAAGFVHHQAGNLQLGIDAEARGELLADGHQGHGHAADEIGALVHRCFPRQQHQFALVHQVGQPIDAGVQHRDRFVVVLRRQAQLRHFHYLLVIARRTDSLWPCRVQFVLRRPHHLIDQVIEPNFAGGLVGAVDDDDRIALGLARAGGSTHPVCV